MGKKRRPKSVSLKDYQYFYSTLSLFTGLCGVFDLLALGSEIIDPELLEIVLISTLISFFFCVIHFFIGYFLAQKNTLVWGVALLSHLFTVFILLILHIVLVPILLDTGVPFFTACSIFLWAAQFYFSISIIHDLTVAENDFYRPQKYSRRDRRSKL